MTTYADARPAERTPFARYRHSLWLLTKRDLHVRYTTNVLGYVWSILDPLLMAGIYYLVFVVVFHRGNSANESPYIVFLLSGLLPWTWFNGAVSDFTRAFSREAKLIRSTAIPRSIWINRIVLSKGIEFGLSLPVLALFVIFSGAQVHWQLAYYPIGLAIEAVLLVGLGLLVAPLVVFFKDLERAVKLLLRLLFYASAVLYPASEVPKDSLFRFFIDINPLVGMFGVYRAGFFPADLHWDLVLISALGSVILLVIGWLVYSRTIRSVLKEM
ncbi:MAG TPA: ABC transporter permease [Humibacter sp.]|nr:ABC transporter permease [Humibacter sp.]